MAQGSVGLFFIEWIAGDRFKFIEVVLGFITLGHLRVPFPKIPSAVTLLPQQI